MKRQSPHLTHRPSGDRRASRGSHWSSALSLALTGAILSLAFQNCGPGVLQTASQSSVAYTEGDGTMQVVEEKQAVAVNYSENILDAMLQMTGVAKPSSATLNSYRDKQTKISETGKAEAVTAPMWMSVTNLAGDVCLDLVNQEKSLKADERRIFPKVDFSKGPSNVSADAKDDVIRRMARSFWGRNETPQEKTIIRAAIDQAFSGAEDKGAQTEASMLFTCSAMLASLDAQKQ